MPDAGKVRTPVKVSSRVPASTALTATVAAGVCFFLFSCGDHSAPTNVDSEVVATFNGGRILSAELDAASPVPTTSTENGAGDPELEDSRVRTINDLVVRKVLVASIGDDDDEFLERSEPVVDTILRSAMVSRLGWHQIELDDDELRGYYESNPEKFKEPEKLRLQQIFLRADAEELAATDREAIRGRLNQVRTEVLEGADFTAMARQHSQSESAAGGGWMTLAAGAKVFPSFTEAVWGLEIGGISEVIETPRGFHLVILRERRPAFDREFADVREFVAKRARESRLAELQDEFIAETGDRYDLVRHYDRLDDPFIDDDEALFETDQQRYTFGDLLAEIDASQLEQLYAGFFPRVIKTLDLAVANRLLVAEARRLHLDEDPKIELGIRSALDQLKSEIGLQRRLTERVADVPDDELLGFFWQNRERYQTLLTYDLSLIQLRPDPGEELWSVLKRAESLAEEIRAGTDFEALARAHSRHYSAKDGGRITAANDHLLARQVQSTAKFRRLLARLSDGELSEPFFSECYNPGPLRFEVTGVMLVRMDGTHPPRQLEFDEAEEMARTQYLRRFYSRLVEEEKASIIEEADVSINPAARSQP